jgi:hypothetical protein
MGSQMSTELELCIHNITSRAHLIMVVKQKGIQELYTKCIFRDHQQASLD